MLKIKIGENSGIVWTALSKNEGSILAVLKQQTKLTDRDLFLALGWLAREDKVSFREVKNSFFVSLKKEK